MKIKQIYWRLIEKAALIKTLLLLKLGCKTSWGKGLIEKGAIIDGPIQKLILYENAVIEKGAIINTRYEGRVIIGKESRILYGAMLLTYYGNITIGKNCTINPYAMIYGQGDLVIDDGVRIATHTVIIPSNHTFEDRDTPIYKQPLNNKGIHIQSDVWIGCGVKILDGITIKRGSIIAAGAVVNRDTEPFSINGGVPSKLIKYRP